jgi:hypothetical protein
LRPSAPPFRAAASARARTAAPEDGREVGAARGGLRKHSRTGGRPRRPEHAREVRATTKDRRIRRRCPRHAREARATPTRETGRVVTAIALRRKHTRELLFFHRKVVHNRFPERRKTDNVRETDVAGRRIARENIGKTRRATVGETRLGWGKVGEGGCWQMTSGN